MNSDDVKELVRNYLETYRTNANTLIDFIEQQSARLEAAEKVCDAAVSYCNPDDDDVCYLDFVEIVERWQQEVRQCADQQQKK